MQKQENHVTNTPPHAWKKASSASISPIGHAGKLPTLHTQTERT